MLSRLLARTSNLRSVTRISSNKSLHSCLPVSTPPLLSKPNPCFILQTFRCFSSDGNNNGDNFSKDPPGSWKLSPDNDQEVDSIFKDSGDLADGNVHNSSKDQPDSTFWKISPDNDQEVDSIFKDTTGGFDNKPTKPSGVNVDSWSNDPSASGDIFDNIVKEFEPNKSGGRDEEWETAQGYKPWTFEEDVKTDVFDIGEGIEGLPPTSDEIAEIGKSEVDQQLEQEKQELSLQLKGPNRAFGDLVAASGITDGMLESLILLKDLEGVEGLSPLSEIDDIRLAKSEMKTTRAGIERQKQEEIAKSRVRRVDDKGRAYGTGRRKCSVARVFIQPGEGKFIVNDKAFDGYFPNLDHRADLLRPFSETKTLGLWDVLCTVKGGGVSGQVGAIRLGISRALQNWEPGLRPNLRAAGFLTRDPRMVERKKPGKAKARKSYQWVKR